MFSSILNPVVLNFPLFWSFDNLCIISSEINAKTLITVMNRNSVSFVEKISS